MGYDEWEIERVVGDIGVDITKKVEEINREYYNMIEFIIDEIVYEIGEKIRVKDYDKARRLIEGIEKIDELQINILRPRMRGKTDKEIIIEDSVENNKKGYGVRLNLKDSDGMEIIFTHNKSGTISILKNSDIMFKTKARLCEATDRRRERLIEGNSLVKEGNKVKVLKDIEFSSASGALSIIYGYCGDGKDMLVLEGTQITLGEYVTAYDKCTKGVSDHDK